MSEPNPWGMPINKEEKLPYSHLSLNSFISFLWYCCAPVFFLSPFKAIFTYFTHCRLTYEIAKLETRKLVREA